MLNVCRAKENSQNCRFVQFKAECSPIHGNSSSKKIGEICCVCVLVVVMCWCWYRCVWASVLLFGTFFSSLCVHTENRRNEKYSHKVSRLSVVCPSKSIKVMSALCCCCCWSFLYVWRFCSGFNGNVVVGRWKNMTCKLQNLGMKSSEGAHFEFISGSAMRVKLLWGKGMLLRLISNTEGRKSLSKSNRTKIDPEIIQIKRLHVF